MRGSAACGRRCWRMRRWPRPWRPGARKAAARARPVPPVGRRSSPAVKRPAISRPRPARRSPSPGATALAPPAGRGFFPLDEELGLLPGSLTPRLHEHLVRLGSWMEFDPAATLLGALTGAQVTEATVRRQTEAAGAILVAWQEQEVARLERECPPAPAGPAKQFFSADGAFVPLLHGEWAEVKTLALGEIGAPVYQEKQGEWVAPTRELSYFSRLADADTFGRLALVETQRRGTESAGEVAAVTDGAEWVQGLIDLHRPDAVRILDFPHAAQRLAPIAQAVWGTAGGAGASGGRGGGRRPGRPSGARRGGKARRGREAGPRRGRRWAAPRRGSPLAPLPHRPGYRPAASRDDARKTMTHTPSTYF